MGGLGSLDPVVYVTDSFVITRILTFKHQAAGFSERSSD